MEEILIKAAQLILSLSILVILHEFGHFLPAKLFGVRVEKFYLFFDPWISLLKFKKGDTEYGIGWVPLGGYVKLSGMVDESMDTEQLAQEPQDFEFRSKPAWQRLIIMIGGVTVNVLLGIFIYAMILFTWGKVYLPANEATYGVDFSPYLVEIGFENGDKIVALNGDALVSDFTYQHIYQELMLDDAITNITVNRNGEELVIQIPTNFETEMLKRKEKTPFMERIPFVADTILKGSNALTAGMEKGDVFQSVNGVPSVYFMDFVRTVSEHKGETVDIEVLRNGESMVLPVEVSELGRIGVGNKGMDKFFKLDTLSYSFFASFPAGAVEAKDIVVNYVRQFKLVFTKEGIGQVGGFGAIGNMFPGTWNWHVFWKLTAFLSMVLAFMNILPIPALDGGHVLFLIYELISGKPPNDKFMEYAQMGGMILLLGLLVLANGNDLIRAIFD